MLGPENVTGRGAGTVRQEASLAEPFQRAVGTNQSSGS
ncbi:hypothetical protein STRDD12_01300 [Streptococcus sp. DD12]|nr:hypothetical protein STRDD12_01300 [Streptococcus sp. DD12]